MPSIRLQASQPHPADARPADARPAEADFARLYEEWFDDVVRWLPAMGARIAEREDLAQEIFLVARRKWERFDGERVGPWLYAIALRVVRNHRRLAWFRQVVFRSDDESLFERRGGSASPTPEESLDDKRVRAATERALAQLPAHQRRAFVLFELEELSGQEIAELEGIPVATVWTRVHHARRALKARLEGLR